MRERILEVEGERVRFLVDHMLGALARNLRMFGFDAEYTLPLPGDALVQRAVREDRWLLTRRTLTARGLGPAKVLKIQEDHPHRQVVQVLQDLPYHPDAPAWFTRCLRCNASLVDLLAEEARQGLPEYIGLIHSRFRRCPSCGRVYWPGTHAQHMRRRMEGWLEEARRRRQRGPKETLGSA